METVTAWVTDHRQHSKILKIVSRLGGMCLKEFIPNMTTHIITPYTS